MSKKTTMKPLAAALGTAFALGVAATPAAADNANPFGMTDLSSGYQQVAEGKCGAQEKAEKKGTEAKCGEGKCGAQEKAEKKGTEAKCGEGKCGEGKKATAKEQEAKCGAKKPEAKCGEAKCGAAK